MYIPATPVTRISCLIKKSPAHVQPSIISQLQNGLFLSMGKNAFWYIIKHLKMNAGDEVLVPAYMCNGALLPFYLAGVKLRYYDITENLGTDLKQINNMLSGRPRLLVIVHYFGFPQPVQGLIQLAEQAGVKTVEDCAYSYGSFIGNRLAGTFADYGLFSIRKCLPIPNGGVLLFNKDRSIPFKPEKGKITVGQSLLVLRSLLANIELITGIPFVRYLKFNSAPVFEEQLLYDIKNFHKGISPLSLRILSNLENWGEIFSKRRANYQYLLNSIKKSQDVKALIKDLPDGTCPMNFPALVNNRDAVMKKFNKTGLPCFVWPELPDEVEKNLKSYPVTEYLVKNILLFPIHQDLRKKHLDYIADKLSHTC
jgi:perosamine synthetase